MKNFRILSIVASVLMTTATFAQNAITALDASIKEGKTGDLVIQYQFDEEDKYAGFQFDIILPEGIILSTNKDDIIKDICISEFTITLSSQPNNTYRLTGYPSGEPTPIPGTNGTLLTLKLSAPSIPAGTDFDGAKIQNARFTTLGSTSIIVEESTFTISIVEVPTVILSETSEEEIEAAEGVNVKVIRTINADEWSTICLPFEMDKDQVEGAFGTDVLLGDFTGCDPTITDDNAITAIKVNFNSASSIDANHPYIIKVSSPIESFTVNDVVISPTEEPFVDKDEYRTGSGKPRDPYVYYYNSFIGTYVANTVVPELCLFLNGNKFWYSTGNTKMKAFRGYFDFYDILSEVENANSNITFGFDEADGINNVTVGQPAEGIYDIQGRKVHTDENKWDNLKKGVYIINGKKIVK